MLKRNIRCAAFVGVISLLCAASAAADQRVDWPDPSPAVDLVLEDPSLFPGLPQPPVTVILSGAGERLAQVRVPPPPPPPPIPPQLPVPTAFRFNASSDELYRGARELIEQGRYDVATQWLEHFIERFSAKATAANTNRVDAAMYWKAYAEAKQLQVSDALETLTALQKRFGDSRWLKDARALEVEVRQSTGQAVSAAAQADEDLKLLALRGLMRSDPERTLPMVEQVLGGNSSVRVKENALFVLSQSRSPRAWEIISGIAKGSTNPDLQLKAIRYIGTMGGPDRLQTLADIYRGSTDTAVKHAVLQSFHGSRAVDRLAQVARTETDLDMRRRAIRFIGATGRTDIDDVLRSLYVAETNPSMRHEIINALFAQQNAAALVALGRAEKDPALKKDIVSKLSVMPRSKEATDYLLELLK